jgi:hypothetical protein
VLTPEAGEALVADYEARVRTIVDTCLPAVRDAAADPVRRGQLGLVDGFHAARTTFQRHLPWLRRGDERLAELLGDVILPAPASAAR